MNTKSPTTAKKDKFIDVISEYSFKLALCEVSLGSILHGLKIPFTGQFLSINQIFFLTLVSKKLKNTSTERRGPIYVSQISALLKSLSPAGKKLGPMVSISMQGNLYVLPQYLLSTNLLSIALGAILASMWAFVQPLLTYYIIFGNNLIKAYTYFFEKVQIIFDSKETSILAILLVPILVKATIALSVSMWVYLSKSDRSEEVIEHVLAKARKANLKTRSKKKLSLVRDLTRPIFIISIVLTSAYIYLNRHALAPTIWTYLRPIAVCIVLLQVSRSKYISKLIESRQDKTFFQVLKRVNLKLNNIENA